MPKNTLNNLANLEEWDDSQFYYFGYTPFEIYLFRLYYSSNTFLNNKELNSNFLEFF